MLEVTVPWTTQAELNYLGKIGKASPMTETMPKETLLRGYLEGAKKRHNWGDMDKELVIRHAQGLLIRTVLEGAK
jgi:hypothetical protein